MEKSNHHYVPQHWIKRFTDDDGNLYIREVNAERGNVYIGIRGTEKVMNSPFLYTRYDAYFNGADALENALAEIEGNQSRFLDIICNPQEPVGEGTRHDLVAVLALQALRHPDVLAFGRRRALDLGKLIHSIKSMTPEEFMEQAASQFDIAEPLMVYEEIQAKKQAELDAELAEIMSWSEQNPQLAETDTLDAFASVCRSLDGFDMILLDIRANDGAFVLGDTPMPQSALAGGFTVPLSKRLAVAAIRADEGRLPQIRRRFATVDEIAYVNRDQWNRHAALIAGESRAVLKALPPIATGALDAGV
ncbi:MAG: DUF4238 domain-containing protein [Rhodanobacter sp.]